MNRHLIFLLLMTFLSNQSYAQSNCSEIKVMMDAVKSENKIIFDACNRGKKNPSSFCLFQENNLTAQQKQRYSETTDEIFRLKRVSNQNGCGISD